VDVILLLRFQPDHVRELYYGPLLSESKGLGEVK
jgi:hypothetical protein